MIWKQILATASVVLALAPQLLSAESSDNEIRDVGIDDTLTYQCAKGVATMVEGADQAGPLFSQGPLVFTSVAASNGSPLLIATAGIGTYVIPLDHAGINRIRFELPTTGMRRPQSFYLSYLHDNMVRSRVFEFSAMKAPVGKDDLDYRLVQPQPASYLRPHLEHAIGETAAGLLTSYLNGHITRQQVNVQKVACEHLEIKSPALAHNLRHNLDELEQMVGRVPTVGGRSPASVRTH